MSRYELFKHKDMNVLTLAGHSHEEGHVIDWWSIVLVPHIVEEEMVVGADVVSRGAQVECASRCWVSMQRGGEITRPVKARMEWKPEGGPRN